MYITTPDQAQEIALQKQSIQTQKYHLRQLLDRRIQAALERNDRYLVTQLETERRSLQA